MDSNITEKNNISIKNTISRKGSQNPVRLLPTDVARKIAAGEVIDRPASILRELLDNAVDSGADFVTVDITGGGIDSIRVKDNGTGMTKEDLHSCAKPHSTSKITSEDDLQKLSTLGFRGEALASIAAVSRLEITSLRKGEKIAYKMTAPLAGNGENQVEVATLSDGTVVSSKNLFENIPARRLFLKRPATETTLCKQTFIEKAMPFPEVGFKFIIDGKEKFNLVKNQSLKDRFAECLELSAYSKLFQEVSFYDKEKSLWKGTLVLGDISQSRTDKKHLYIFVNGRRVTEFSLVQAIEYGSTGFFPNGTHPIAALFLDVDSSQVDFNIHPAKKEVKFLDIGPIHHAVSVSVRNFYAKTSIKPSSDFSLPETAFSQSSGFSTKSSTGFSTGFSSSYKYNKHSSSESNTTFGYSSNFGSGSKSSYEMPKSTGELFPKESTPKYAGNFHNVVANIVSSVPENSQNHISQMAKVAISEKGENQVDFKYLGQLFNVFLIVEKGNSLFLVDQHAGHERLRYEALMKNANKKQNLLIPYRIKTDSKEEDNYLEKLLKDLKDAGFEAEKKDDNTWEIKSVPITWQGTEAELKELLLEKRVSPAEIMHNIYATAACRSAIKEGNILDSETAISLIKDIFALEEPHCPHGRPLWIELTQEKLYELIKRT